MYAATNWYLQKVYKFTHTLFRNFHYNLSIILLLLPLVHIYCQVQCFIKFSFITLFVVYFWILLVQICTNIAAYFVSLCRITCRYIIFLEFFISFILFSSLFKFHSSFFCLLECFWIFSPCVSFYKNIQLFWVQMEIEIFETA